jgi:hypothetical protein
MMFHDHPAPLQSQSGADRTTEESPSPVPADEEVPTTPTRSEAAGSNEGEHLSKGGDGELDPVADGTPEPGGVASPSGEQRLPATQPDNLTGWSGQRATLLPPPPDLPPVTGSSTSVKAEIPLEERIVLAAAYCYLTWFAGGSVRAKGLMNDVQEFRGIYAAPNAIGTLLGKGVAGHGLGLFRRGDIYPPTYANGWQLAQGLTSTQFEQVARRLGFDGVEALAAAVRKLPEAAS